MRCLIRADAGEAVGTGHVMRCLTIAEELVDRGHEVILRGSTSGVPWLDDRIRESGVAVDPAESGVLSVRENDYDGVDVVIVDSYVYPADAISTLNRIVPTLVVMDGDGRGIDAAAYLDQNLGASGATLTPPQRGRLLAGPRFALVRREIRDLRRRAVRTISNPPRICAFMGGSDPTGAMVTVAKAMNRLTIPAHIDLVVTDRWRDIVARTPLGDGIHLHRPTPRLPRLLADADVVISATGTSAWDVCTLGVPAVFTAVIDNQRAGFEALREHGLALGVDLATAPDVERSLMNAVLEILDDGALRRRLFAAAAELFDGRGAERVADRLELLAAEFRAGD